MAYATVTVGTPAAEGSATVQHTIALPTHAAGDRLVVVVSNAASRTISVGASTGTWTQSFTATTSDGDTRLTVYYRDVAGAGETLRLDTSDTARCCRIPYLVASGTFDSTTAPAFGTAATGVGTAPNPPDCAPSWGSEENVFLACYAWDTGSISNSGYPTGYTGDQGTITDGAGAGCGLTAATKEATAASDNPDAGAFGSSANWVANTLAIRPYTAPAVTAVPNALAMMGYGV